MKNHLLPTQKPLSSSTLKSIIYAATLVLALILSSCETNLLQEGPSSLEGMSRSARLSSDPIFSSSYEVEEFSATQFLTKIPENSKDKPFLEIAAQPRLDRQKIEFKLFGDGNYEIVTTQLDPTRLELLPSSSQKIKS